MKRIFILKLFLWAIRLFAQNNLVLVDSIDLSPVANAVISSFNQQTISDENGRFNQSKFYSNKVTISHISYQSKSLLLKQGLDTILLNRKVYSIPEIEVRKKKNNFMNWVITVVKDDIFYLRLLLGTIKQCLQRIYPMMGITQLLKGS